MERFKTGGKNTPQTKNYKGFTLHKCWCGYPEMRWMVYYGEKCITTTPTLKGAKMEVDEIIADVKSFS